MKSRQLVSFDLQGTLSSSAFSDEYWLKLLPSLYAEKYEISIPEAQEKLEKEYQESGKYHELFYNHRLRLNQIFGENWNFIDLVTRLENPARIFPEMIQAIKSIPADIPVIILSATTRDFIDYELGSYKNHFFETYSTIDDFKIPGKPVQAFEQICKIFETDPAHCIHIGDCKIMDYQNSQLAGWQSLLLDKKLPTSTLAEQTQEALDQFLFRSSQG